MTNYIFCILNTTIWAFRILLSSDVNDDCYVKIIITLLWKEMFFLLMFNIFNFFIAKTEELKISYKKPVYSYIRITCIYKCILIYVFDV